MSGKKKPVTVADLARNAKENGAKKGAGKKAAPKRAAAPASAKAAYEFVARETSARAETPRPRSAPKGKANASWAENLCRFPVVRTVRQAAQRAKAAAETAKTLGEALREQILKTLAQRFA